MRPFPFSPLGADDRKVEGVHLRLDLDPVLPPLARGVGRGRDLDHDPFVAGGKRIIIGLGDDRRIIARHLRSEMEPYDRLEPPAPFLKRETDEGFAVEVQDIEDIGYHLDRLLRIRDIVTAAETAEHGLEGHGFSVFDSDHFTVKDHIMVRGQEELLDHVRQCPGHVLKPAGVEPGPVAFLVELEPRPVVLELCGDLPVLFDHIRNSPLLGKHHPDRVEQGDADITKRVRADLREPCHLAHVIEGLHRVLHESRIHAERLCNRFADAPLPDTDAELFEHDPGKVAPFKRVGVSQKPADGKQLLPLRLFALLFRDADEGIVDMDEVEILVEEGHLGLDGKEFLDCPPHIAGPVDLLDNLLFWHPRNSTGCLVQEVGTDPEFPRTPVREDPAHDKPDKDRQFLFREARQLIADDIDHIEPAGGSLQSLAGPGKVHKKHGSSRVRSYMGGWINIVFYRNTPALEPEALRAAGAGPALGGNGDPLGLVKEPESLAGAPQCLLGGIVHLA